MELNAKMQINVEPDKAYEAFVDPAKIGRFWFSSSSERWETGKTIQLQYKEYDATMEIFIKETIPNEQIKFNGEHIKARYVLNRRRDNCQCSRVSLP